MPTTYSSSRGGSELQGREREEDLEEYILLLMFYKVSICFQAWLYILAARLFRGIVLPLGLCHSFLFYQGHRWFYAPG